VNSLDKVFFAGKRVLITGARGFIGYNIVQSLKTIPCQIVGLSRAGMEAGDLEDKGLAKIDFIRKDITVGDPWTEIIEHVDIVFHLAAQTSIYYANNDPAEDLRINVLPFLKLLEACKTRKVCPVIIQAGTVTQAGIPEYLPVNESHPDRPATIYDIHKLTAERYLAHYITNGYVKGATLRLSNVYGPGPKSSRKDRGILNQMISRGLAGQHLTLFGKGDFIRDYIYITDVVNAFLAASRSAETLSANYFVLGSGKGITIKEAFQTIAQRIRIRKGLHVNISHVPEPHDLAAIERRNFYADISQFSRDTDWTPSVALEEGLDRTIDWYLQN
jgi:nucleoside-diphosphate-sugar epimerase